MPVLTVMVLHQLSRFDANPPNALGAPRKWHRACQIRIEDSTNYSWGEDNHPLTNGGPGRAPSGFDAPQPTGEQVLAITREPYLPAE
jgi:hypothetical protein